MVSFWQNIPLNLDPIAFSIGFFAVYWYAIFFLLAFFITWRLFEYLAKKEKVLSKDEVLDLTLIIFLGALIGGRLGFALLYEPAYFLAHPLSLVSPYDSELHIWTGISGMSFHGGLIGAGLGLFWFAKQRKKDFWNLADLVSQVAPLGLFFGRIGNFLNNELYGRITEKPWGMFFSNSSGITFRHSSALYEALLEGIFLYLFLFWLRKYIPFRGGLTSVFLIAYAAIRFFLEFYREPDAGVSLFLSVFTRGQGLSFMLFIIGVSLFLWLKKRDYGKISLKA